MTGENPDESNRMRAIGEADRTKEFKGGRAALVSAVDGVFDELYKAKDEADRPFKFGSAVFGALGIKRDVVENPFGGPSLTQVSAQRVPGLYVGTDPQDGQEVVFLRRPDKSSVEIRRDSLLKAMVVPSDPEEDWVMPAGTNNADQVVTFTETQPDGGALGYSVTSSGDVMRHSTEPGRNGMNRSGPLSPSDHEVIDSALMFLNTAHDDFFTDNRSE